MNQSGIGLIKYNPEKSEFRLFQNPELLNSFGLGPDSTVYGFYYPKPNIPEYDKITIKDDIMLTPVPYYLWDRSARLIIHMEQQEGTLRKITQCLQEHNVSIISSISTRSGYRHATYTLHVSFGGLPEILSKFDEKNEFYVETEERVRFIEKKLIRLLKVENIEAHSQSKLSKLKPVIAWANNSLAYFHNHIKNKKKELSDHSLIEPFPLKLSYADALPYFHSPMLNTIIRAIQRKETHISDHSISTHTDSDYEAITFSELDTRTLNIRMAIISKEQSQSFFELGMEYVRTGDVLNSKGLIAEITNKFPKEYNLWRSYNFSKSNSQLEETGCVVFLIEDVKKRNKVEDYIQRANHLITDDIIPDLKFSHPYVNIIDSSVSSLTNLKIKFLFERAKLRKELVKYPIFISYSHHDKEIVKEIELRFRNSGIIPFLDEKDAKFGNDFTIPIREALNNCLEMCLVFTQNSKGREWVNTEWGAMWAMGKRITPIMINTNTEDLPLLLRNNRGVIMINTEDKNKAFVEIESYIKQVYDNIQNEFHQQFYSKFGAF